MSRTVRTFAVFALVLAAASAPAPAAGQSGAQAQVFNLGQQLERLASGLAVESYERFRDWNGAISDQEQAILFKSEAFAASCRLLLKLT